VDVLLLAAGAFLVGWQIVQVADDIKSFATVAAGATTEADLERAADHLARAVTVIGVALFAALIAKGAQRAGLKSKLHGVVTAPRKLVELAARLNGKLDDAGGVVAKLINAEKDPRKQAELLKALERLEQQLPNYAGRPRLRVTQTEERWLRVSDMFDEAGQTGKLTEIGSRRTLSASDQGRYLGKSDTREANAVLSSWNRMNIVEEQIVPKGSIVLEGPTSPKTSAAGAWAREGEHLSGGGMQIFHFGQLAPDGRLLAPALREAATGFVRDPTGKKLPDM
jgi:hypothetical protein